MKSRTALILGLCIAGWICLLIFAIIPFVAHMDIIYEGQETFLTQGDFEAFKNNIKIMIYEDNLRLHSFDVLASDPPIIVNFEVEVPYNYSMPYGEAPTPFAVSIFLAIFLSIVAGLVLIYLPIYTLI